MIYEIARGDGTVVCRSHLPFCGYGLEILKDLEKAGYILLADDHRRKYPTLAQWKEATGNA